MDDYHFLLLFKYLGSFISFNLCDDYYVKKCVTAATQAMSALKNACNSPHLDIWSKYLLFQVILMNLPLWGGKTWSMQKYQVYYKLEVFLHHNIWCILQILIFHVKEERLHNEHMWRMFYDYFFVKNMIAVYQLDFLGKTIRGPHSHPAQQMITACCNKLHHVGCPLLHPS